jgi:hypothetical protein
MTSEDLIKRGNSFVLRAFGVLLIVQLLILPQLPSDQRETNQIIGTEVSRLKSRRQTLQRRLNKVAAGMRLQEMRFPRVPGDHGEVYPETMQSGRGASTSQVSDLTRQYAEVLDELAKNGQQIVTFEKSKYSRELKIPGTDAVLDEGRVRTYYASGLALTLIVLAFAYRKPVLKSIEGNKDASPPFWAAPIAYGKYDLSLRACMAKNLLGLGMVMLVFEFFLESTRRFAEFFVSWPVFVLNWFVGIVSAATYCVLLINALRTSDWKSSTQKGR